ncbi:toxin glutamine deamidase domain-containing protein [Streptomyces sp. NPDC002845]
MDQMLSSGARSNALPNIGRGPVSAIENFYGHRFRSKSFSNIVKEMQNSGNGAGGIVHGLDSDGGHVFNVVNIKGRVTFLDGQTGNASHAPSWGGYMFMRTN